MAYAREKSIAVAMMTREPAMFAALEAPSIIDVAGYVARNVADTGVPVEWEEILKYARRLWLAVNEDEQQGPAQAVGTLRMPVTAALGGTVYQNAEGRFGVSCYSGRVAELFPYASISEVAARHGRGWSVWLRENIELEPAR